MEYISFSAEEIEDILYNLEQCESEGYLHYGSAAYSGMQKIQKALDERKEKENKNHTYPNFSFEF